MFQFIEPEEHYEYKDLITPFLKNLKDSPQLYQSFDQWREAFFLLAKGESNSTKGGALLLKQRIEKIHPTLQVHLKTLYPTMKYLWTGAISLQVHEEVTGRDFEKICRLFYTALLSDLIAFGIRQDVKFLALKMLPIDYHMIDRQSFWPYMAQVSPQSSRDDLFHGILTLINPIHTESKCPRCLESRGQL